MLEEKIMFCKEDSNVMKISILEQFNILNEQIKDIYGLISSVHKYYSALCSSIVGIAILLYSNDVTKIVIDFSIYFIKIKEAKASFFNIVV